MEKYFKKEINASEAVQLLGWSRSYWNTAMAGIISAIRNNENFGHIGILEE
jgi:hypothetical protein